MAGKSNAKTYFALAAGALILWYFMGKKKLASATTFSMEKLGFDIKGKKIKLTLGANNPTGSSATLNSLVGALYIKGNQVSSVESFTKVNILPNAKSLITLDLKPSLVGIFATAKLLLSKGGTKALDATFEGNADVDGLIIPIKTKLN